MNDEKIRIISEPITVEQLKTIALERYGDLIKAVVDAELGIMAIGGEMHADEESILLDRGSTQANLWGINIYPNTPRGEMIEYDSIINIRPRQNNRSRGVDDLELRKKIMDVVMKLIV